MVVWKVMILTSSVIVKDFCKPGSAVLAPANKSWAQNSRFRTASLFISFRKKFFIQIEKTGLFSHRKTERSPSQVSRVSEQLCLCSCGSVIGSETSGFKLEKLKSGVSS